MKILGLTKTTLLDYPGRVAATVFIGGCNFRCPFCHNRDIVFQNEKLDNISEEAVLAFLLKRKNVLLGICISGGEPTLNKELVDFICKIKEIGYAVKLDTNGSNPQMLRYLIDEGLIDYCAMDIKNCESKYALTCGVSKDRLDLSAIKESVDILLEQEKIGYEFRTTVVRQLHCLEDIRQIAIWIQGAKSYFLQSFENCENVISDGLSEYSKEELSQMVEACKEFVPNTKLRGDY
jgi:anaerobic ribonucleoside-triphosphate reductase activating protein